MVFEVLGNVFSSFFGSILEMLYIVYVLFLVILFFALEVGIIYAYYKIGKLIASLIPKLQAWFDLNKDRFSNLLDRK